MFSHSVMLELFMGRMDQTAVCLMGPVLILVRSSFSLSLSVFFSPLFFASLKSPFGA